MNRWDLLARMLLAVSMLPTAAFAQDRVLYADALGSGVENYSWASNDLAHGTVVRSGSAAIAFEPDGWAGLYLHSTTVLDFADFAGLQLYLRGAAPGAQALTLSFQLGGSQVWSTPVASVVSGGSVSASEWRELRLEFSGAGAPSGNFDGVILMDASGGNQATVYVDDVVLLAGTPPPPPGTVTLSVDRGSQRRAIDPLIYSVNFGSDAQHADLRYPSRRWGGNSKTRYNWQVDVHNTASDYFYQNIVDGDGSNLPADSTANRFIASTRAEGGTPLITLPTIGWVPVDVREKRWGFSVAKYGAQTLNECTFYNPQPFWCSADAGNGLCGAGANCVGGRIVGNDPTDTSKAVDASYAAAWVSHLRARHGPGVVTLFALDNEPMLWNSTHRDVHPEAPDYDEVWTRGRDVALAIKAVEPQAQVFGPVTWGWCDFFTSAADAALGNCFEGPDRSAHGGLPFVEWYLQQVCATAEATGVRPVDYLDLHYYPQGADVDGLDNDAIAGEAADVAARRLRSLKELYDPGHVAESWIGDTAYPIPRLLPRAREAIATHCPGVKLALTEYKWGPDDGLTGALAQAELLALFGREGVDYASRWIAPEDGSLAEDAFRLFLDHDGQHTRLLGHSVAASSSDAEAVTVYAIDGGGTLYVLSFNHSLQARALQIDLGADSAASYSRYRLDGNGLAQVGASIAASGSVLEVGEQPARSAELWVIRRAAGRIFADGFEGGG